MEDMRDEVVVLVDNALMEFMVVLFPPEVAPAPAVALEVMDLTGEDDEDEDELGDCLCGGGDGESGGDSGSSEDGGDIVESGEGGGDDVGSGWSHWRRCRERWSRGREWWSWS